MEHWKVEEHWQCLQILITDCAKHVILSQKLILTSIVSDLHLKLSIKNQKVVVICFYRSPSGTLQVILEKIKDCLHTIVAKERKYFNICGDFNIDLMQKTVESVSLTNHMEANLLSMVQQEWQRIQKH